MRGALLLVERGEAPVGTVYATDAAASPGVAVAGVFPADSHPRSGLPVVMFARNSLCAFVGPAWAVPSTFVSVTGQVAALTTLGRPGLRALPQVTRTDTYTAAGSPVTDTFTGPTLWGVLQAAGGVSTNPAVKNDVLQSYVVAAGTDGYKAAISAGEISPKFREQA